MTGGRRGRGLAPSTARYLPLPWNLCEKERRGPLSALPAPPTGHSRLQDQPQGWVPGMEAWEAALAGKVRSAGPRQRTRCRHAKPWPSPPPSIQTGHGGLVRAVVGRRPQGRGGRAGRSPEAADCSQRSLSKAAGRLPSKLARSGCPPPTAIWQGAYRSFWNKACFLTMHLRLVPGDG